MVATAGSLYLSEVLHYEPCRLCWFHVITSYSIHYTKLYEHIALTDHLAFAIKRAEQDLAFHNPFLYETKEIYPLEFELAEYAIDLIHKKLGVDLGDDEIGFVALHINSAITNRHISEVRA